MDAASLSLISALLSASPAIGFDVAGGDAWTFRRLLEGTAPAACEDLFVHRSAQGRRTGVEAEREGPRFRANVALLAGENRVWAECRLRGRRIQSPSITLRVRLAERPKARIRIVIAEDGVHLDSGASTVSEGLAAPIVRSSWSVRRTNPERLVTTGGRALDAPIESQRVLLASPSKDGEYYVALEIEDARGAIDRSEAYFVVESGRARTVDPLRERPAWVERAVVYGAVPFLFGERGLASMIGRLDELAALGVDTIWLSPILESPPDDYGYAVTDYFDVRDSYGTREDLRALISAAHARGLRVIMDFVPNHTSDQHPYFIDAENRGGRSPYYAFYERGPDGEPEHYFDWENLPNLDYDHPEVRRFMIEAFSFWVRELDLDGFRLDAIWGVQRRAPELVPELVEELVRIKPDLFILAEASARDPYWFENGADAAYDWTERLGVWSWRRAFEDGPVDVAALHRALVRRPKDGLVLRFLDNNDTGERFATRHGEDRYGVAAAMLFTLPGVPALFTGDEIAAEYEPYQRVAPLSWRGSAERRDLLKRLISLRRDHPELAGERFEPIRSSEAQTYAYRRGSLLVVLNFSEARRTAVLSVPSEAWAGELHDLLGERPVRSSRAGGGIALELPPHAALVLER